MTTSPLQALIRTAHELTESLSAEHRYERLLQTMVGVMPCDAAAMLRLDDGVLRPLAVHGLSPELMGHTFVPADHPRLSSILGNADPTIFAADDARPDPYDGHVLGSGDGNPHVHSCMGTPLWVGEERIGVLTLDALAPGAFDGIDLQLFSAFAALASAAVQAAELVESLEVIATRRQELARDLVASALRRHGAILGQSRAIQDLRNEIDVVAGSDLTVLIAGETGTGKELVARTVHARSGRSDGPLVYVNCAALPETIAESELFGHVRGAFTGARANRPGKFELADAGTLFLDEIGELPLSLQPKLLRAIQFGEIQRVGTEVMKRVDVRIVAATNRDLAAEVAAGRFRADLYHRLSVYPLLVAPLRERDGDIALLAGHFLDRARVKLGCGGFRLTSAARKALERYSWPGNVRELDHVITRAALRAAARQPEARVIHIDADLLDVDAFEVPAAPLSGDTQRVGGSATRGSGRVQSASNGAADQISIFADPLDGRSFSEAVDDFKRATIEHALQRTDGNWAAAARFLQMDRGNLHRLAKRLGANPTG